MLRKLSSVTLPLQTLISSLSPIDYVDPGSSPALLYCSSLVVSVEEDSIRTDV